MIELVIERPVAGGRMLARHEGKVVFVAGAIPGERVRARVTRTNRQSVWADADEILESSPDRRVPICDPACGGLAFAHIGYSRQRALKAEILADAFRRLARIQVELPAVAGSPEAGYRLRARLHVRDGQPGFFREGTHVLCDAGATQQLTPEALRAVRRVCDALGGQALLCDAITVTENVAATERVVHLEPREDARMVDATALVADDEALARAGVTGITTVVRGRLHVLAGSEIVTDTAASLFGDDAPVDRAVQWSRRPTSFFQGNRFLTGPLVARVLEAAEGDRLVDLYAGVGLFSVALAARGSRVVAVEGDESSAWDLRGNAEPWRETLRVDKRSVEDAVAAPPRDAPDVVVLDPPRTGVSSAALEGLAAWQAPRLVYVSCDPPTLARDAARLAAHGYRLISLEGFDLFPNTPHVEAVAVFSRR